MSNISHIIIQAGGKGTRLEHLTANKPKALVPVDNLPMIFHLFKKYPDKRFIIIADYKKEVLREYLACFAEVKYRIIDADGAGTCAGVRQAADMVPENEQFMLLWSDLILPSNFSLPENEGNFLGVSQTFPCRWSYENGVLSEQGSTTFGVAGLFIFADKSLLTKAPQNGEFVRWLKEERMDFEPIGLAGTREFGLLAEYEKLETEKSRPFNKVTVCDGVVTKAAIDKQGEKLAERECKWYEQAARFGVTSIPEIYSTNPLEMEYIKGKNVYECSEISKREKVTILGKLVDSLNELHQAVSVTPDSFSMREAYYNKTMDRLSQIRDLVPFADQKHIVINGRTCRNVFFYKRELEALTDAITCDRFVFIHGDCTFSNIMLREDGAPVFIDPRGYFGCTELYGDPNYDWAKLYYSVVGNYDRFNLKDFRLSINENGVELEIGSNDWACCEDEFFELSGADRHTIKSLHAVIWLSLTTYAWQDYDSICGAFYNGLYYLEEIM